MVLRRIGQVLATVLLSVTLFGGAVQAEPLTSNDYIELMVEGEILKGDSEGDLNLDRNITAAEAARIMARTLEVKVPEDHVGERFNDPYLLWAYEKGVADKKHLNNPGKKLNAKELTRMAEQLGFDLSFAKNGLVTRGEFLQTFGDATIDHITIAHTNDVHGHIEEDSYNGEFGYAKMATLIKQWREESENFLLLDAGDTFQGTIFVNQFQGETVLPILNYLDYDVMAAGNHEFDFGYEQLLNLKDQLDYPMISSNVFKLEDGSTLLAPVHYQEVAGKKYAFVGFVAEETPVLTHPDNVEGLTFKNPVTVAQDLIPKVQEKADHVVVVSHVGINVDREIAASVDGIDLIVGGHSHTPLEEPERVNDTYIVQDWEYGKSLGRADLYYVNDKLVRFKGGLVDYDPSVEADPEVEEMVENITSQVDEKMNEVITTATVPLNGDRVDIRSKETNLGNLITDILREKTQSIEGYEADVALMNGGGIRAKINEGEVTKMELYNTLPFPNTLTILDVTGAELKEALENGVSKVEEGAGRFPQISGMTFTYNSDRPAGERVEDVTVGGEPLQEEVTYKLATNDFLAVGGDGYEVFKDNESFNTGYTIYNVVEEYFMKQETVSPEVEGRIVDLAQQ
ncbi:hypothetical protein GCM10011389_05510 [Pontibacillus salipaludis]|uniref:5'-nucleotidase n=1 Tax=Pontibacillus salipaludis TaxID=1697394 RepID=A0ABQ1PQG3_9BACI|nr:5'-nucleotidase C-terminal domain-containing protein [Pontibacillus salipaludis]GGD01125.1 hypothetical protein GCM10011389_05510 [Pontibacillus salipaludis]